MAQEIQVRVISAAQALTLRGAVLRPGRPIETAIFAGDESPENHHFGAFLHGQVVGVVSLFVSSFPSSNGQNAWQLRGMAVEPSLQKSGIGKELVRACVEFARGTVLWCNARSSAVPFYRNCGFETQGEEFEIPEVGPHFVMVYRPNYR